MNNDQKTNTIRISCPHCGVVLETDGDIAGTQVNCPECGGEFVPAPDASQPGSGGRARVPKKGKRLLMTLLGLLIVVIAGVTSCYRKQQSEKAALEIVRQEIIGRTNQELSQESSDLRRRIEAKWMAEKRHLVDNPYVVQCEITSAPRGVHIGQAPVPIQKISLHIACPVRKQKRIGYRSPRTLYVDVNYDFAENTEQIFVAPFVVGAGYE